MHVNNSPCTLTPPALHVDVGVCVLWIRLKATNADYGIEIFDPNLDKMRYFT